MPYVYEFLYRGGAEPAWHVIMAVDDIDAFGAPRHTERGPMTMDQASAEGHTLPVILSSIDATTLAELDKARVLLREALANADDAKQEVVNEASLEPAAGLDSGFMASVGPTFWDRVKSFLGI